VSFPTDLSVATFVLVGVAIGLGALGGIAHWIVDREAGDTPGKGILVGIVAALGTLAFTTPTSIQQLGLFVLVGFFGRAVLAALQSRVIAAVQAAKKEDAKDVAAQAIALLDNQSTPPPAVAGLRARLTAIR
jgi:hypothetical protein